MASLPIIRAVTPVIVNTATKLKPVITTNMNKKAAFYSTTHILLGLKGL